MAADGHAGRLMIAGRLKEARALIERSWQSGRDLARPGLSSVWNASGIYSMLYDPREGLRWVLRELDAPRTAHAIFPRQHAVNMALEDYLWMGELPEARRLLNQIEPGPHVRAYFALFEGDWEQADSFLTILLNWCANAGARAEYFTWFRYSVWARRLLRNYSAAEDMLARGLEVCSRETLPTVEMQLRPELVMLNADTGRDADSNSQLVRCRELMSEDQDWLGLAGMVSRAEAIVASAEGRLDGARAQFQKAIKTFQRYRLPWEEAETLHYWGRALNAAGEQGRANEKFDAALEIYKRHGGGQRWIDRTVAEQARIELPAAATPLSDQRPPDNECMFRREGEYWTIGYGGVTCRLKDMKGLGYIAHLIAHPGHRIHVLDLFAQVGGSGAAPNPTADQHAEDLEIVSDPGDAGEVLDSRARAEYRQRLSELHAELDEAERNNDLGRAERMRNELDSLTDGLRSALGLGGRSRRFTAETERARGTVSKSIRVSLERIRRSHPKLGDHLSTCVRTGYFCAYLPDPGRQPSWRT